MNQAIDNTNLLSLAWGIVKPYLMEAPKLLQDEFNWLEKTSHISNILTSPELLFEYMGFISTESPSSKRLNGDFYVNATICRTKTFKRLPPERQLSEVVDITNIFQCFLNIFSNREKQVKDQYRDLLEASFYDYKIVKFYYLTTHDLIFEGFNDLIKYFDKLCSNFTFDVVITKSMIEYFCMLMTSVVSRYYKLTHVLSPSYAYYGLLPLYAAVEKESQSVNLMMSITISRCFVNIPKENFYEDETPLLITYILKRLIESLDGSVLSYMSPSSIFNSDILGIDSFRPAKNAFTPTKNFTLGANKVQIFSYNKTLDEFIAVVTLGHNPSRFIYITEGLCENNTPPMSLTLLPKFAITSELTVRKLSDTENTVLDNLIGDLRFIFQ